jgi:hypothetical protein
VVEEKSDTLTSTTELPAQNTIGEKIQIIKQIYYHHNSDNASAVL